MWQGATNNNDYNYIFLFFENVRFVIKFLYELCKVYNYLLQFNEHKLSNSVAKITPLENTDHSFKTIDK